MIDSLVFCPNLWKGLHVGTLGEVKPCCFWPTVGNLHKDSIESIWNSDTMKLARRKALNGEKIEACKPCYEQEQRGQGSTRLGNIGQVKDIYKKEAYGEEATVDPWFVDLRMSNKCNLQCRTCYSGASSVWEKKVRLEPGQVVNTSEIRASLRDRINIATNLKEIYFAGGEPVIIEEDTEILKNLISTKQTGVHIRYNTNGMVLQYGGENIVDLWEEWVKLGGYLQLGLSIDGFGKTVEYIRTNAKWSTLDTHVHEIVSRLKPYNDRVLIEFTPVVSIMSVLSIPDLIEYVTSEFKMDQWGVCFHNILNEPQAYDLRVLPSRYKDKILRILRSRIRRASNEESRKALTRYREVILGILNQKRELLLSEEDIERYYYPEPFNSVCPELANWWKDVDE